MGLLSSWGHRDMLHSLPASDKHSHLHLTAWEYFPSLPLPVRVPGENRKEIGRMDRGRGQSAWPLCQLFILKEPQGCSGTSKISEHHAPKPNVYCLYVYLYMLFFFFSQDRSSLDQARAPTTSQTSVKERGVRWRQPQVRTLMKAAWTIFTAGGDLR